jgi:MtN3 and saliva related transmembrane protein
MVEILAVGLSVLSSIPQIIKSWKTKLTKDLSYGQIVILSLALFCWLIHGINVHDMAIIIANSICLFLQALLLFMKVVFDKKEFEPKEKELIKTTVCRLYDSIANEYRCVVKKKYRGDNEK